jgi:ComF family protein
MTAWSFSAVCEACVGRVGPQTGALCGICGEALGMESARFAEGLGATACTLCRRIPPAFERAVAYAAYDDELREMLHLLKYERARRLAEGELGRWLAEAMLLLRAGTADNYGAADELTVIAVPLFAARERVRGFNQSVLLADAAVRRLRASHPEWTLRAAHGALARTRDTDAQFGLSPRERRRNLLGAFRVVDDSVFGQSVVRGREVLLVDDIMTTGATARECAAELKKAGAAKVWVATLARAQAEAGVETVAVWETKQPGEAMGFG